MKFTIVSNEHEEMAAYKLAKDGDRLALGYNKELKPEWSANRWSREIDSFYDRDNCKLCELDGKSYLVEFDWETKEPLVWCEVVK